MKEKEHHLLCLGVMAQCYEYVPDNLKMAIREGIEAAAVEFGFPVRIPEYWIDGTYHGLYPMSYK